MLAGAVFRDGGAVKGATAMEAKWLLEVFSTVDRFSVTSSLPLKCLLLLSVVIWTNTVSCRTP